MMWDVKETHVVRRWMRSFWNWNKAGCLPQHQNLLLAHAEVEEVSPVIEAMRLPAAEFTLGCPPTMYRNEILFCIQIQVKLISYSENIALPWSPLSRAVHHHTHSNTSSLSPCLK